MATQVRTIDFLPEIFKTKSNEQFLAATLDQIAQQPDFVKVQGFVGSKFGYGVQATDGYLSEPTKERADYQLEPSVVFKKKDTSIAVDAIPYSGLINGLDIEGALVSKHDRLFSNEFYSWDSFTDLDKIINYSQYYWLPQGPDSVIVTTIDNFFNLDFNVSNIFAAYKISSVEKSYSESNPTLTLIRGGTYTFNVNQNSNFWIQTEPGVDGVQKANPNISTRVVYGVDGNGLSEGQITFTVPLSTDQTDNLYSGDIILDLATTKKFDQIHGKTLNEIKDIDGVVNLNDKTLMFYKSLPTDSYYRGTFLDEYEFDSDAPGNTQKTSIEVTQTSASGNLLHTSSTIGLRAGADITFSGIPFGGILVNRTYYIKEIIDSTTFTISESFAGPLPIDGVTFQVTNGSTDPNAPLLAEANVGGLEEGKFTRVNNNFYRIKYVGDLNNPTIYLEEEGVMPTDEKIYITSGTEYTARYFVRNYFGEISMVEIITSTLNTLYYQDGSNIDQYGKINIIDQDNPSNINVENDILGKKTYTGPNGITFTNGLKVTFFGNVFPISYLTDSYYVEGVGSSIVLVPASEQLVPEPFTEGAAIPFESGGFDTSPYSDSALVPELPDYITIRRGSKNKNAWSRSNRWFHVNVLNATLASNPNSQLVLNAFSNSKYRAKRPIIEFYPDLKLFNSGSVAKAPVDFIDLTVTNAFTQVYGKSEGSYSPDGSSSSLFDGARIIFANDSDPLVRNQIFVVALNDINSDNHFKINLTRAVDSPVQYNDQVVITKGEYSKGLTYYFDGLNWKEGQSKSTINQQPLFDIFDSNGNSFGNEEYYPGTDFVGTKLFSYAIGSGEDDSILKFPIKYSSIVNIGDIVFESFINSQSFNFINDDTTISLAINNGYVHSYTSNTDFTRLIGWQTAVENSFQYQIFNLTYNDAPLLCDIAAKTTSETKWPSIVVYEDNERITDYTFTVTADSTEIILLTPPATGTPVEILIYSDQVSNVGYYQIPSNFDHNPFNEEVTTINLGDLRGHYKSICNNITTLTGNAFGPNNFRDLGNLVPYGTRIVQNSAPLTIPAMFTKKSKFNFLDSLKYNRNQYIKFKIALLDIVNQTDYLSTDLDSYILDDAIGKLSLNKDESTSFFYSDMVPVAGTTTTHSYAFNSSVDTSIFPLTRYYDFANANYYSVLVYLSRKVDGVTRNIQLLKDIDYTINPDEKLIRISTDLLPNDVITVKEYSQTCGSFVPNTPSKLGFYPSFVPEIVFDNSYMNPTYFIKGHDGSFTKLYGEYVNGFLIDNRDRALFEFEKRVYNNLKVNAKIPIEYDEVFPGYYRKTDYSLRELNAIYSSEFLNWAGSNNIDYKSQRYLDTKEFTWNYKGSKNKIDNSIIEQGNWRGIYLWMYDSTTPHSTPWEILGLSSKPAWWDNRYGEAPYTSENTLLWDDISNGYIWNNGEPYINTRRIRNGLMKALPVDTYGKLLSPFDSVVGNYSRESFKNDWNVFDFGPAEYAYRTSSNWPFDLLRIFALTKPAEFFSLGIDLDSYKYNTEFNQYLVNNRKRQTNNDSPIYGSGTATHSLYNWVVDHANLNGVNNYSELFDYITNIDVRLSYRLAGFSDKSLLKFFAEKGSPNSKNASLLIPDESFTILLNETQPYKNITYSSVIIQKTNAGFRVYGNDREKSYFTANDPRSDGQYENITVGSQSVNLSTNFFNSTSLFSYGYEFTSVKSLADFLNGYGYYLKSLGLVFESTENGIEINWKQMVVELLYWIDSGWEEGSVINLNPNASVISIENKIGVMQSMSDAQSSILNQNLINIPLKDLGITRIGTKFTAKALNSGDSISFFKSSVTSFEHVVVFDNVTVFNDTLFNLISGLRQQRLFVKGSKTATWDGTLNAPGFVINQDNVPDWQQNTKYNRGSIVKYKNSYWSYIPTLSNSSVTFKTDEWNSIDYHLMQKGLLPNASTRAKESTLYYDSNITNLKKDADLLSFSLIGYRPRPYLSEINLNDNTQVNLYKSMLVNKGTKNSLNILLGATLQETDLDYTFHENWAIKNADFGGTMNKNFIEVTLDQSLLTGNPAIVSITKGTSEVGAQQEIQFNDLKNYGTVPKDINFLPTISATSSSKLPSAGYVNIDDVVAYSYYPGTLNGSTIGDIYKNDYIWVADVVGEWKVYTPIRTGVNLITVRNTLNNQALFIFDKPHDLVKDTLFGIINFGTSVNGYYTVMEVISLTSILVIKTLDKAVTSLSGIGIMFKLGNQRVEKAKDILGLPLLNSEYVKNKVWVDQDVNSEWNVLQKSNVYSYKTSNTPIGSLSFGATVCATEGGYLIADPDVGTLYYYIDSPLSTTDWRLYKKLVGRPGFGQAMATNDEILVVSQPDPFGDLSKIYIYRKIVNDKLNVLVEEQVMSFTNSMFGEGIIVGAVGSSLALSGDGNYLYISATDLTVVGAPSNLGLFFSFQLDQGLLFYDVGFTISSTVSPGATQFEIYGDVGEYGAGRRVSFTTYGVGDELYTIITTQYNASKLTTTIYVLETIPYTISTGSTMYLAVLNYSLVGAVSSENLGGVPDRFGNSLATNYDGTKLFVGAPLADFNYVPDTGTVLTYNRLVESWEVVGDSPRNSVALFFISWTPNYGSAIYINDVRLHPSYYVLISNVLITFVELKSGDIITVSSGNVVLMQKLLGGTLTQDFSNGEKFGFSLDCNVSGTDLIVGSPNNLDNSGNEGAVFRFTNEGKRTGTISGLFDCRLLYPVDILINGYRVQLGDPDPYEGIVGDAYYVANRINLSVVNNVFAYAFTDDGGQTYLRIRLRDFNLGPANNKLNITVFGSNYYHEDKFTGDASTLSFVLAHAPPNKSYLTVTIDDYVIPSYNYSLSGNTLTFASAPWDDGKVVVNWTEALAGPSIIMTQLGIAEYITTEVITDPKPNSRTSFGYSVKFNELNSFIVGAPTTDRYLNTTFDFTDDTNNHNDCVFDNNFTQWEDNYKNAGQAYVYEYIDSQGETLLSLGNYVYSQSLPDLETSYGKQPYYGKAVALRNNRAIIGAPSHKYSTGSTTGRAVAYQNLSGDKHWSVFRKSSQITDVSKIQKVQLYDNTTNLTLDSLDYFDPLQGKLLGTIAVNLDYITSVDPAGYNNDISTGNVVWAKSKIGTLWFDISSTKFINYHQDDIEYNSKYWGAVFPGSIVTVYSWIESDVFPINYAGPGTPYDFASYSISYETDAGGNLNVRYYYWVRNTNTLFSAKGKTLTDTVIENYILNPRGSGISYFTALKPNVFGLYNVRDSLRGTKTNLHIGYSSTSADISIHGEVNLIRSDFPSDFLPGIPDGRNYLVPEGLYKKFIESLTGQDDNGQVLPNPNIPKLVQIGTGVRPGQTMFINRTEALKNYIKYANKVLKSYPIRELPNLTFLSDSGDNYDTTKYWNYIYWWAEGYSDTVKPIFEVDTYPDLIKENLVDGAIVGVAKNLQGHREIYKFTSGSWERIGLENGTIEISSKIWNPIGDDIGYGDNFFDVLSFDSYPVTETKNIIRALNEQIYIGELLEHRNKSLILMFEYIQSENIESQNYLPWLNKTSLADVSYQVRELKPYQKYQSENINLLEGFINEVKPYHTVLKEFYFTYFGTDLYQGSIFDFDLPAKYNLNTSKFESPKLKNTTSNSEADVVATDSLWTTDIENKSWYDNYGLQIDSAKNQVIGVLGKYMSTSSQEIILETAYGVPVTGLIKIDDELIRYTQVDREHKSLYGISRGVENTTVTEHLPGAKVFSDLSGIVVIFGGRGYVDAPVVKAYIDLSKYPAPRKEASLKAILIEDRVVEVQVLDPGEGYVVTPDIVFEPAFTIDFNNTQLNYEYDLLVIESDQLQTSDQVKIVSNSNTFESILPGYYYVKVLGFNQASIRSNKPVISLHYSLREALSGEHRVSFKTNRLNVPLSYTLEMVPRAVVITNNSIVRGISPKLRFDRTSYKSLVVPWESGIFWPSVFVSLGNDSSSTLTMSSSTEYKFDQYTATLDNTITISSFAGLGLKFSVFNEIAIGEYYVTITSPGVGFRVNDTITITGNNLGGSTPSNDIVITITEISGTGSAGPVKTVSINGDPYIPEDINANELLLQSKILTASLQGAVMPIVSASVDPADDGAIIKVNYVPSNLKPGQVKGLKTQFFRNLPSYTYNDTGANFKATFEIGETATFQGTIAGTILTVTSAPTGVGISIGDLLTGGSIATDIYIVEKKTGTSISTNSSWVISSPVTQVSTVTFTVTPVTMTVTEVTKGKLSAGQTLSNVELVSGTKIASIVIGTTGGVGYYKVTKAQTITTPISIQTNGGAIFEIHRPNFDPQVIVNRYYLKIIDPGTIYRDGDVIIIPGNDLGGVTGTNDAVIDINYANDTTGEIQVSKVSGLSVGFTANYYIFPVTPTELKIFSDSSLIKPTPFTDFIFKSDGTSDFAYLAEPLITSGGYKYVVSALVSYNKKVYRCIESNSDDYFDYNKWQEVNVGDRSLNAVDRIAGYYEPTANMPAKDMGQLLLGVTNPNPTYLGNSFAPDEVLPLDSIIKDTRFYPRDININAMIPIFIYDEAHTLLRTEYIAIGEANNESLLMASDNGTVWLKTTLIDWSFKDFHIGDIGVSDIAFNGFFYVATTTNAKTGVLISPDKVNWVTIGQQITFDFGGYSDAGFDELQVDCPETPLNAVITSGESFIACGMYHIVKSDDGILWRSVYTNTSRLYQNLNDIKYIETTSYIGFLAVGVGNKVVSGQGTAAPVVESYGKIMLSDSAEMWGESPVHFSSNEFFGVASSNQLIVVVGAGGDLWISLNASNWAQVTVYDYSGDLITSTLRDVIYANDTFIAVGNNGIILTSSDGGYVWQSINTSGLTNNLINISYDGTHFYIVGSNGAMFRSLTGDLWTDISNVMVTTPYYEIKGSDFLTGYGPEEMIPGVISDTISFRVTTRPGSWWDVETVSQSKLYGYTGFNMKSRIDSSGDSVLSFADMVTNPAQLSVFVVDNDTFMGPRIYQGFDYTVNWITKEITLVNALSPNTSVLIEVYEIGNGNQIARGTTDNVPLKTNLLTGNSEIELNSWYILLETPLVYHNGSRLVYGTDYTVELSDNNLMSILFNDVYDPEVDFISFAILQDSTTINDYNTEDHFGYSIPETQVFEYTSSTTFTLSNNLNYLGSASDNEDNAIVELNGLRLKPADYTINAVAGTVTVPSAGSGDIVAVTSYHETKRQYLNTDTTTSFVSVPISYVDNSSFVDVSVVFLGNPGFVTGDYVVLDGFSSSPQLNNIQVYLFANSSFVDGGDTYYPYTLYTDSGLTTPISSANVSVNQYEQPLGFVTKVSNLIPITISSVAITKTAQTFYVVPKDTNRTWVTINGNRVSPSQLRFIPGENSTKLNILTTVSLGDQIIVTSMVPGASPNGNTYLLDINKSNEPAVYQAGIEKTAWIVPSRRRGAGSPDFIASDDTIYLNNISYVIHPDTKIIQINGEKIRFTTVDYVENTISGLTRGIEGTGQIAIHKVNTVVFSISASTKLENDYYNRLWYDKQAGDPIQLSDNIAVKFLNIGLQ